MKQKLYLGLVGVLLLGLGVAIGRFATPAKIVEKVVEKEVIKESLHKDEVKTIVKNKDGSSTTTIHVVEDKKSTATKDVEAFKEVSSEKEQWLISASAKTTLPFAVSYGVHVQRRILGPIYVGVVGFSDKSAGISIGIAL